MFYLARSHAVLEVCPAKLGAEGVLSEARSKLEGRWVVHKGVRVRVVLVQRLASVEASTIDDAGNVRCSVEVDAVIAAPFVGEILDVKIKSVDETGFVASDGAIDVRVDQYQIDSSEYDAYDERLRGFPSHVFKIPILENHYARVKILRVGGCPGEPSEATMLDDGGVGLLGVTSRI